MNTQHIQQCFALLLAVVDMAYFSRTSGDGDHLVSLKAIERLSASIIAEREFNRGEVL